VALPTRVQGVSLYRINLVLTCLAIASIASGQTLTVMSPDPRYPNKE